MSGHTTMVIEAYTMPKLFKLVEDYQRKWPPQGYGTSIVRGGVTMQVDSGDREHTVYWVTMERLRSCD